jgi:hypothetical protein
MKGQGICSGYALLLKYTLDHLGIPAEYVANVPHAWDVVQLDGEWYQTDLTWGAGAAGDTQNNMFTLLMDDADRLETLTENDVSTDDIHLGYYGSDMGPMPACTSTRFAAYRSIGYAYAFDIAGNCVNYSGDNGISRMNLDCTGQETLAEGVYAWNMVFFDDALYYADMNTGYLYRLVPHEAPELLDGSGIVTYFSLDGTTLSYGQNVPDEKTIPLLPFKAANFATADTMVLPATQFTRDRTFRFDIRFSAPVNPSQDWNQLVYLEGRDGKALPLHFELSADAMTLTVRPAQCIADEGTISLCISDGIVSKEGAALLSPCRMDVSLVSSVQ